MKISLVTSGKGFEMNEEMIQFLEEKTGAGGTGVNELISMRLFSRYCKLA